MEKTVLRHQKIQLKVFKIFSKMVAKLENSNKKLVSLEEEAINQACYYQEVAKKASESIRSNNNHIKKINKFME